jgi:hypothetical protein
VFAALLLLVATVAGRDSVSAQQAGAKCTTLACDRCSGLCTAYCEVKADECRKAGKRGCPRNYRSCTRGCTSELCAQCLPVQFGKDDHRFVPGKTELCRTDGNWAHKK